MLTTLMERNKTLLKKYYTIFIQETTFTDKFLIIFFDNCHNDSNYSYSIYYKGSSKIAFFDNYFIIIFDTPAKNISRIFFYEQITRIKYGYGKENKENV
jgi:hypothetical protein